MNEYELKIAQLEAKNRELAIELYEASQRNIQLQQLGETNVSDRNSNG